MSIERTPVGQIKLANFEPDDLLCWRSDASGGRTAAADTELYQTGTQAYRISMPSGGQVIAKKHMSFPSWKIATGDTFSIRVYCFKAPNNWLRISLTQNLAGTGDILRRDISVAGLVAGWNTVTWTRSQMSAFGGWANNPRALGLQIDVFHNVSESVFFVFDDFKVTVAAESRT